MPPRPLSILSANWAASAYDSLTDPPEYSYASLSYECVFQEVSLLDLDKFIQCVTYIHHYVSAWSLTAYLDTQYNAALEWILPPQCAWKEHWQKVGYLGGGFSNVIRLCCVCMTNGAISLTILNGSMLDPHVLDVLKWWLQRDVGWQYPAETVYISEMDGEYGLVVQTFNATGEMNSQFEVLFKSAVPQEEQTIDLLIMQDEEVLETFAGDVVTLQEAYASA